MAIVSIQLSQNMITQSYILALGGIATPFGTPIGGLSDVFGLGGDRLAPDGQFQSWSMSGSTLGVNYTGGATETYTGVVMDNPNAASGHISATGYELRKPGVASIFAMGKINADYTLDSGNVLSMTTSPEGNMFTGIRIATEVPASSVNYNPVFGNVAVTLNGTMYMTKDDEIYGTVNTLTMNTDKFLLSSTIEGSFHLDRNLPGRVSGEFMSYQASYRDGSAIKVGGLAADVSAAEHLAQELAHGVIDGAQYFGGNDDITVDLPAYLYGRALVRAGGGDDRVSLKGGGGQLDVDAGSGNDKIVILGDAHAIDGGSGLDTVWLAGARAGFSVQHLASAQGSAFRVTDQAGIVDQLVNIERIMFTDGAVALDIDGHAGQAYRLYHAALNRAPDMAGLGYWIDVLDHGQSLASVAQGFVASKEFQDAYGGLASNRALVTQFYQNILHRAPEQAGLDYWGGILDTKAASVAEVLSLISESGENKEGMASVIGNGFTYTPYGAV